MSTPVSSPGRLAPPVGAAHARILGIGAYRPERVITNEEVCTWIESSDEWIRERSGIVERRWARPDESVVDMSLAASLEALQRAGVAPADVDAVICATVTWPYATPSAAAVLTERLGATPAAAFDVSAACAGFCHAVALANDMVRGGSARHVLVVGVEKLSDWTDRHDRGTAFLFGDGAGAVLVGPSDRPGIGPTVWGSDGAQWEVISQRTAWTDMRSEDGARVDGEWPALVMAGQTVFRWAVWQMAPVAQKALDAAGVSIDDVDVFVPHQANVRIIDAMVKQLGLPAHVPVARDIVTSGNTSSASVPLALHRLVDEGVARSGDLALLIGFGAGLVYAAQVVEVP
ncbi:beta-ketoacyl-ACP synthase III [Aquipuribacter sp. SD81]|uniref:beta-ketoacyl-ACP synthase III n=1 Tax=Aquipuribacter sp. SD81 TaxID=3127703 RepID=UPI003FA5AE25